MDIDLNEQMDDFLKSLGLDVFQSEEKRAEFIRLFIERKRLEKELHKVDRKIQSFKNPIIQ
jgi:hypothetical protein